MRVVFLCPHTRISGGVKVIFKLAQGLRAKGFQVCVCPKKYNDKSLFWLGATPNFKIIEISNPSHHVLPECDLLVNYGDGDPFIPLLPNTKQILLLQNFGIHDAAAEKINLLYPYNGVIVVSSWLANLAKNCGQKNIYLISPGMDDAFIPIHTSASKIPIIGTLYHTIPAKNVSLFEETIKCLFQERRIGVKALFLSAKSMAAIESFNQLNIPYSSVINPPQSMLPFMYSSCTAWFSPAYREGFGLTTLEAMACGTPVITVPNFGLDDYLKNNENCMIVKNKKEAADMIAKLSNDKELRDHLIENGKKLASRFTWEKTINQFTYALQEIAKI